MQELLWMKESNGLATIEDCIKFANRFLWNLSVVRGESGTVAVLAGDQPIFAADNVPALEAFLYGMGLAYSVMPRHMSEEFRKGMGFSEEEMNDMGFN